MVVAAAAVYPASALSFLFSSFTPGCLLVSAWIMLLRNATRGLGGRKGGGMIAYDILGCGIGGFFGVLFLRAA